LQSVRRGPASILSSLHHILGHFGRPKCKKACKNGPFIMLYVWDPRRIRVFSTGALMYHQARWN
jgi:hypothetical protein